jgi:hypothetical protein
MLAGLTDGLGWIKHIVLIIDDWATSRKMAYRRDQGTAMPNSTEDPVAAVEQRRIGALIAFDINVRDEIIDEPCIHVASNGSTRTKAVFLEHVATREVCFDLFEIDEHHIRAFGETTVGRDLSRYRSDAGEANPPEARAAPARVCKPWRKWEARGASGYGDRAPVNLRHAPIIRAWFPEPMKKLPKPLCRIWGFGSRGILGSSRHDSRVS